MFHFLFGFIYLIIINCTKETEEADDSCSEDYGCEELLKILIEYNEERMKNENEYNMAFITCRFGDNNNYEAVSLPITGYFDSLPSSRMYDRLELSVGRKQYKDLVLYRIRRFILLDTFLYVILEDVHLLLANESCIECLERDYRHRRYEKLVENYKKSLITNKTTKRRSETRTQIMNVYDYRISTLRKNLFKKQIRVGAENLRKFTKYLFDLSVEPCSPEMSRVILVALYAALNHYSHDYKKYLNDFFQADMLMSMIDDCKVKSTPIVNIQKAFCANLLEAFVRMIDY